MIYSPSPPGRWILIDRHRLGAASRFAFAFLLLPLILMIYGCGGELPQGAVAQVGDKLISQEQFDKLEATYKAAGRVPDKKTQPAQYQAFQQSLAEYLVMLEILRQQASELGVHVTDKDVQAELDSLKDLFQGDEKRWNEALKAQKLTPEQFKESLRERLLVDGMRAAVTKDVAVTDEEVKAYYGAHKADYTDPEVRKTRHILISPFATAAGGTGPIAPTEGDWEAARAEAEKVRSEIQNGANFGSEARKYSDDETTRGSGGEVGSVIRGQMVPQFEEAVFSLKKGELSRPVKTEYGYHIIQVTDITPAAQIPYEQVKEKIRSALLTQRQTDAWEAWLEGVRQKLGVVYRSDLQPVRRAVATTTTTAGSSTSSEPTTVSTKD